MNLEKLKKDLQNNKQASNMSEFNDLIVIYLGVEKKEYFPKLLNQAGNKVLDSDGKELRATVPAGYTFTFSEVGTSKIVKVVLNNDSNFELMQVLKVSGLGYDIRQGNMIFIQENGTVKAYE